MEVTLVYGFEPTKEYNQRGPTADHVIAIYNFMYLEHAAIG
jgi:hypothetical protein